MAGIFGSNKAKDEQAAADRRLRRLIAEDQGLEPEDEESLTADAGASDEAEPPAERETEYA